MFSEPTDISAAQGDVFLLGYAAHVENGVAHAAESRVYADVGGLGNILETHVAEKAHVNHLALELRQLVHDIDHIGSYLRIDHEILNRILCEFLTVEKRGISIIGRHRTVRFFLTVIVDDMIVCDAGDPCREFSILSVSALLDRSNSFDKSLLEYIVGKAHGF